MPSPEELERMAREINKSQPPSVLERLVESGEIPVVTMPRINYSPEIIKLVRTQEIPRVSIREV